MSCNQQFIRVFDTERLDANQRRSNHDGMVAVGSKGILADKPWQPVASFSTEGDVMAELLDCASGLTPSQDVPFAGLLEFDCDPRSAINPGFTKPLHRGPRKR